MGPTDQPAQSSLFYAEQLLFMPLGQGMVMALCVENQACHWGACSLWNLASPCLNTLANFASAVVVAGVVAGVVAAGGVVVAVGGVVAGGVAAGVVVAVGVAVGVGEYCCRIQGSDEESYSHSHQMIQLTALQMED
ncbi:hypothetical protein Tco_1198608 [Tanacetum coccineum]